jgi:hypothetical protein
MNEQYLNQLKNIIHGIEKGDICDSNCETCELNQILFDRTHNFYKYVDEFGQEQLDSTDIKDVTMCQGLMYIGNRIIKYPII